MKHLDLFSGIGGFAYAIDQVWDNVEHVFCDYEQFPQQVLKKHWPEAKIYGDIREITTNPFDERLERLKQKQATGQLGQSGGTRTHETSRPFIVTGGFPCQPFSTAGLRRGTADERHLWPEMLRVIQLTQPTWVIAENVYGLLDWNDGLVFEQVCTDLETSGYEVQPFVIPAVAVNAPHRRYRVWFVGHAKYNGRDGAEDPQGGTQGNDRDTQRPDELRQPERANSLRPTPTDTRRKHGKSGSGQSPQGETAKRGAATEETERFRRSSWHQDWYEVATEFCSVDDGLPVLLDGLELSKSKHRKEQLKAYGNAIVPEVAVQLMKSIRQAGGIT